jgi:hypothetical protein
MTRRILSALFVALVSLAVTSAAQAQSAGGNSLENLRDMLKHTYGYSFNGDGTLLSLTSRATSEHLVDLVLVRPATITMKAAVGSTASLSATQLETVNAQIDELNTSMGVGTFVEIDGTVYLVHHVNTARASMGSVVDVIARFVKELQVRKVELFG